jgi:hypothetical protein
MISVDTSDARVRRAFEDSIRRQRAAVRQLLRRLAIDEIPITTTGGYIEPLMRFFRARERRVARG